MAKEHNYEIKYLAADLKAAREHKGLSQRALAAKSGVPQSHISKIESGAVDIRLSSLVTLARILELELTLVPRKAVPAVKSIINSLTKENSDLLSVAAYHNLEDNDNG